MLCAVLCCAMLRCTVLVVQHLPADNIMYCLWSWAQTHVTCLVQGAWGIGLWLSKCHTAIAVMFKELTAVNMQLLHSR